MSPQPKNKCLHCNLIPYAKHLCRRHYKKMLAIKNGTYKKDYERRKKDPAFMEKKKMLDQIYREKKKLGIPTSRKTDDNSEVNRDWKSYSKRWAITHKYGKYKALKRNKLYNEYREKIISHYTNGTNSCASCGCSDIRVLDIDHVNNDGAAHRKAMGCLTSVWWIIKNNFPIGFQILCKNCNWLKEMERRTKDFENRNI